MANMFHDMLSSENNTTSMHCGCSHTSPRIVRTILDIFVNAKAPATNNNSGLLSEDIVRHIVSQDPP